MAKSQAKLSEVELSETPAHQRARIRADDATTIIPSDGRNGYFAETMTEAPTTSGKGGGGSRKGPRSKKRGTRICRRDGCNLEASLCGHEQRGRPKAAEPKTASLRPYLPRQLKDFLRRSRLQLTDVLEAVLDSPAMACWRQHARTVDRRQWFDENDNEIKWSAYDEKVLERRSRGFRFTQYDFDGFSERLEWLKELKPTLGPQVDELVTPALLARVSAIARAGHQPKRGHPVRYSLSKFCTYCVEYYVESLSLVQSEDVLVYERVSSREEAKLVKQIATSCRGQQYHH